MTYDVLIVGGGIIGASIAYELSKYNLKMILLEKNPVFADETSKGNSGVIHGGFDPDSHKIEARLNVLGNKLWREEIFKDLLFPRAQVNSLVLAFNEEEMKHIKMLYERGLTNGVLEQDMKILTKDEVIALEPNVNKEIFGALLCTSSWAIDPVRATYAFLGAAKQNGLETRTNAEVVGIKKDQNDEFEVSLKSGEKIKSKIIINAAGHYADEIAKLAGYPDFKQTTRRGQYRILSREQQGIVKNICFMVPTIHGKGVVVAPMLDGRVLVGPTAENGVDKKDTRLVTSEMWDYIGKIGTKIIPSINLDKTEISLAGSRPIDIETNDFIIKPAKENKKFINAAGMQSPAIASAPAIALEIAQLVKETGIKFEKKSNFNPKYNIEF